MSENTLASDICRATGHVDTNLQGRCSRCLKRTIPLVNNITTKTFAITNNGDDTFNITINGFTAYSISTEEMAAVAEALKMMLD